MGAAADGSEVGIAGDQPDLLEADTEPFDDELGEARLVTLAGRQRAEHDVDAAVGTHRDLGALARHAGVELDVVGEADAAVPATLARREAALLEPVPVGPGDHAILGGRVVAAVVDEAERVAIRHRVTRHEVAPPQRHAIEAVPARRDVDQPLDHEHDLRPARRAIRRRRRGVAQHRAPSHGGERYVVDAGRDRDTLGEGDEGHGVGSDVAGVGPAHGEEVALGVERQLHLRHQVATLVVGEQHLAPVAGPLHGAAQASGGPRDQRVLRIAAVPGAVVAADVARHDANRRLRHAEHAGHVAPDPPRSS